MRTTAIGNTWLRIHETNVIRHIARDVGVNCVSATYTLKRNAAVRAQDVKGDNKIVQVLS